MGAKFDLGSDFAMPVRVKRMFSLKHLTRGNLLSTKKCKQTQDIGREPSLVVSPMLYDFGDAGLLAP
jgi:hypothetical protein